MMDPIERRLLLSASPGLAHTTANLSQGRAFFYAAAVGNKVLFAGGNTGGLSAQTSNVVDIYDVKIGQWSSAHLSQPRTYPYAVTVGDKVLFAGGLFDTGVHGVATDVVDVYDDSTGQWSVTHLPHADPGPALAVGSKVIFAGGRTELDTHRSTADIYDAQTGKWTTINLPLPSYIGRAVIVGRYGLFSADGGVNVYDTLTGQWSAAAVSNKFSTTAIGTKLISVSADKVLTSYDFNTADFTSVHPFEGGGDVGTVGAKIMYAGGSLPNLGGLVDAVRVYNTASGKLSATTLSVARLGMAVATLGPQVFFAGGNGGGGPGNSNAVDIFTDAFPAPVLDGFIVRGADPQSGAVSVTIRNTGDEALAGPFDVTVYGARPGRRSIILGTVTVRRSLRAGESRKLAADLTLPVGTMLTDYRLAAATNAGAGEAVFASEVEFARFTSELLPPDEVAESLKSATFSVAYHSPFKVDSNTFDGNDIIVTGPNGFEAHAQVISDARSKRGSTRVVTYAVHSPGRRFDPSDNGTYTIHLQEGQVKDASGNAAVSDRLGMITVALPAAAGFPQPSAILRSRAGSAAFAAKRKINPLLDL